MKLAFPLAIPPTCQDYDYGMSLREYLTAAALTGLLARLDRGETTSFESIADAAVRHADATLARLEKRA